MGAEDVVRVGVTTYRLDNPRVHGTLRRQSVRRHWDAFREDELRLGRDRPSRSDEDASVLELRRLSDLPHRAGDVVEAVLREDVPDRQRTHVVRRVEPGEAPAHEGLVEDDDVDVRAEIEELHEDPAGALPLTRLWVQVAQLPDVVSDHVELRCRGRVG